ncbi:caspase-9-like [Convolutriloba macropyga]|uniref:caspase-9-like n=1 Tax=Convolutriloba macropyga TaxID=536237 RepID=UPI003F526E41
MNINIHNDGYNRNLSTVEMENELKEVANLTENIYKFLIVVIMSHGKKDAIMGCDYNPEDISEKCVKVSDILKKFIGNDCWNGRPKLFFIQACQGVVEDTGFHSTELQAAGQASRGHRVSDAVKAGSIIPKNADMFVAFSSDEPYASFRDPEEGSLFLQELVESIQSSGNSKNLLEIMTRVIYKVQQTEIGGIKGVFGQAGRNVFKQSPYFKSFLGKLFFFPKFSSKKSCDEGF